MCAALWSPPQPQPTSDMPRDYRSVFVVRTFGIEFCSDFGVYAGILLATITELCLTPSELTSVLVDVCVPRNTSRPPAPRSWSPPFSSEAIGLGVFRSTCNRYHAISVSLWLTYGTIMPSGSSVLFRRARVPSCGCGTPRGACATAALPVRAPTDAEVASLSRLLQIMLR